MRTTLLLQAKLKKIFDFWRIEAYISKKEAKTFVSCKLLFEGKLVRKSFTILQNYSQKQKRLNCITKRIQILRSKRIKKDFF